MGESECLGISGAEPVIQWYTQDSSPMMRPVQTQLLVAEALSRKGVKPLGDLGMLAPTTLTQ